jgi:hypothetical protein
MSEQNNPEYSSNRPTHASLPPGERVDDSGGWRMALPALVTLGGGLAALWLLENQTGGVSRTAGRARETAGEWLHDAGDFSAETGQRARHWASGASHRAADTAGDWGHRVNEILGSGASRAAKLMAFKSLADYATSAARHIGESSRPVRQRARHAGEEGSERLRGAYAALRGQPFRRHDERDWGLTDAALIGVALAGAGVAATYLLNPERGAQRRRALRLRTQALSRQAGDWAHGLADTARDLASSAAEGVSSHLPNASGSENRPEGSQG